MPDDKPRTLRNATNFTVEHTIPAESRPAFMALEEKLEAAARKSAGCQSVKLEEMPSDNPEELHYRTTMVFESQDALIAWVDSDVRHDLVHEAREAFTYGYALKTAMHGFSGWFPKVKSPPPMWKMNLLVLTTLYPTVLLLGPVLAPVTAHLDFATTMLLANLCSVTITGCFLMPLANRIYGPWLTPPVSSRTSLVAPLSALLVLALAWGIRRFI